MTKHNPNTGRFWDVYLTSTSDVVGIDFITEDRINLAASLIPNERIKILDIGAGYGFLEKVLQKKDRVSIFGIDISPKGVIRLRNNFTGFFLIGTAISLPIAGNSFDYVCLMEVLEHLYSNEGRNALAEIKRVLKQDGRLIISVPLYDRVYKNHPSRHVRFYTPELAFSELNAMGFEVINKMPLYAFSRHYKLKSLLARIFRLRRPNNLIIFARKK